METGKSIAELNRQMHQNEVTFAGYSLLQHVDDISELVKAHQAKSLLDYGCGKGKQYLVDEAHKAWGGLRPHLYDPYYFPYSATPYGRYDGVICTDVLEHVPEEGIDAVLGDLALYADKFVFLAICTREAKKCLPDGRNAHLTVKPQEWWMERIKPFKKGQEWRVVFTDE